MWATPLTQCCDTYFANTCAATPICAVKCLIKQNLDTDNRSRSWSYKIVLQVKLAAQVPQQAMFADSLTHCTHTHSHNVSQIPVHPLQVSEEASKSRALTAEAAGHKLANCAAG